MPALLLGIFLAAAITAGPLRWAGPYASSFSDSMISALHRAVGELLAKIPGLAENSQLAASLAAVVALTAPGVTTLVLSYAASRAVPAAKSALSLALLAAAVSSFFFLPATAAVPLLLLAFFTGTVLLAPAGFAASSLLWALSALVFLGHLGSVWDGSTPALVQGRDAFIAISGIASTEFWSFAAYIVALAPFVATVGVALRQLQD
jgi:hypothetical protein